MKTKYLIIVIILFVSLSSFSQQLTYKTGGRVFDSENIKLSHSKVRELLQKQPELLKSYNEGLIKQNTGNLLLAAGVGFILADFTSGLNGVSKYPTVLTDIGAVMLIMAIPVKTGYSEKIKTAVEDYNKTVANKTVTIDEINIISNKNGIGLALSF